LSPRRFRALATLGALRRPFGIERRVFGAASIVRGCTRHWPMSALGQSATCVTSRCGKNNRLVRSTVVAGEQYHVVIASTLLMRCSLLSQTKPSPGRLTICRGLLIAHTTSGRRRSSYGQSASNANCAPAGGAADLALGGSGHTDTINSCPAHSASDGDLRGYAIRLMKGRGRHSLR
jgi:hypothetical protein